jgi:hypothetical protein
VKETISWLLISSILWIDGLAGLPVVHILRVERGTQDEKNQFEKVLFLRSMTQINLAAGRK